MKCRLCGCELNQSNKCESHIIPKAIFKDMKNGDDGMLSVDLLSGKTKRSPQGGYDSKILCRFCDNKFSIFDQAGVEFTRIDVENLPLVITKNGQLWIYENTENKIDLIKKFVLSVILRSSYSDMDGFKSCYLGNKYEQKIAEILFKGVIIDDEIVITCGRYTNDTGRIDYVVTPARLRVDQVNIWRVMFNNGIVFFVKIDQRPMRYQHVITNATINNQLLIKNMGNFRDSREFQEVVLPALKRS